VPSDAEVTRFIAETEHDYADATVLRREIAGWFNPDSLNAEDGP